MLYRRVSPSRMSGANGASRANDTRVARAENPVSGDPTDAETIILQCVVSGALVICVLLLGLVNIDAAANFRNTLRNALSGAETPTELFTVLQDFGQNFGHNSEHNSEQSPTEDFFIAPQNPAQDPASEIYISEPSDSYPELYLDLNLDLPPFTLPLTLSTAYAQAPSAWIPPANGRISSPSGNRINPVTGRHEFHDGIDIAVPVGTPILAPKAGEVTASAFCPGYGNFMRLAHADGYTTFFAHLYRAAATVGEIVPQGARIAYSGNTGQSTGPHLHFSIFLDGQFVDPLTRVEP
ncbi:MAG: M23 family metallopeptidase [Defluviitaleaceae bacterium]|nr:M23 family metallopeptidase [Defluviitaleaceae bacterium]